MHLKLYSFPAFLIYGLLSCPGCDLAASHAPSQDSWHHFVEGGVFDGGNPSLSPDGKRLAYASPRTGHGDIYLVENDNPHHPIRLTMDERFETSPMIAPDGLSIAFVRESDNHRMICTMTVSGELQRQLTTGYWDEIVSFSADGSQLVISRTEAVEGKRQKTCTLLLDISAGTTKVVANRRIGAISRDLSKMLYTEKNTRTGINEIWAIGPGPTKARRIGYGWEPSFSADGSRIVYKGPSVSTVDIWIMDCDGTNMSKIEMLPGQITSGASFGGNDNSIVMLATDNARGVGDILNIDIRSGRRMIIATTE